ncbi:FAD-binding protein [Streptomyces sp. NPDC086519]|uniref:FAD-binding protein n=1 Tax=Streptomyces sp. NPDC086519 TaxID=3154863 RepID=UPI00341B5ED2
MTVPHPATPGRARPNRAADRIAPRAARLADRDGRRSSLVPSPYRRPGHARRWPCAATVVPTDLGTQGGLVTGEHARVLDTDGRPVAGPCAAGNTTAARPSPATPVRGPRSDRAPRPHTLRPCAVRAGRPPAPRRRGPDGGDGTSHRFCEGGVAIFVGAHLLVGDRGGGTLAS